MNVVEAIGRTPLFELGRIASGLRGVRILAKGEHLNPGGSVKDRPARAMIFDGIERGALTPGKTILEATSGNTGIADAMIGRALGFRVAVCLPGNASAERRGILTAYGAELFLTDPLEGTDGAIRKARELAAARPDLYFYPDQYSNAANWRSHFETVRKSGRRSPLTNPAMRPPLFSTSTANASSFSGIPNRSIPSTQSPARSTGRSRSPSAPKAG